MLYALYYLVHHAICASRECTVCCMMYNRKYVVFCIVCCILYIMVYGLYYIEQLALGAAE